MRPFACFPSLSRVTLAGLTALGLTLFAGLAGTPAQVDKPKDSSGQVKVTARAGQPDAAGNQTVVIDLAVNDGWYVYANPVGLDLLEGTETTVSFKGNPDPKAKVVYPEGQLVQDKTVGNYKIYQGKVSIQAAVQRASPGPVQIEVKVNACSKKSMICLPTGTLKFQLK